MVVDKRIVSKRPGSPYRAGRSNHWLTIKYPGCAGWKRKIGTSATAQASKNSKGSIMSHTKEAAQRKYRTSALPVLGAAGLSFSLASDASAAITNPDPARLAPVIQHVMNEEEIFEVSLATFRVYDDESTSRWGWRTRPTVVSQGACGADLYLPHNPPAVSGPIYQAPPPPRSRPTCPGSKHKRS